MPSGIGDLVVTTLTNSFMPLIRYRIGDLVEKHPDSCRTTYMVHGRAADALTLPSGRRVTVLHVDRCFAGLEGFAHYQLSELAGGQWLLRFVPDLVSPADTVLQELGTRLASLLELPDCVPSANRARQRVDGRKLRQIPPGLSRHSKPALTRWPGATCEYNKALPISRVRS